MIVAMGDTHLHPNAWASMPQVKYDTYSSFEQIVTYAMNNKADAVVLPGDVFDTHPPSETVAHFLMQVWRLKTAKIPLYTIQGQHGRTRSGTPWPQIDTYVVNLEEASADTVVNGCGIYGLDNRPPEDLREALAHVPSDIKILFLHQMCRGLVPEIHTAWDLDPSWVPPTVELVIMGDYHQPIDCHYPREEHGGSTRFYYTGSAAMMSIDEPPEKSFLVIDEKTFKVTRVPLKTRPFKKFELRPAAPEVMTANLDAALIAASTLEPETLCVVNFDPRQPNIEEAFRARAPKVHFMFRPIAIESAGVEARDIKVSNVSLIGCLDKVVDREKEAGFHSFVLSLLQSKDPKGTLLEARKGVVG